MVQNTRVLVTFKATLKADYEPEEQKEREKYIQTWKCEEITGSNIFLSVFKSVEKGR